MDKIKVLVIEDNNDNWVAVKSNLRKHAACQLAETVGAGFELFEKEEFDIVLLDLQLPDRPGLDFVKTIRQGGRHSDIPVIAISASVLPVNSHEALDAGCNAFISKPFTRSELLEQLKEYLPNNE